MQVSGQVADLFASGLAIDAIVLFMIIEYAALFFLCKKFNRGASTPALLANGFAGAALLLSLRAALIGSSWQIISLWLLLALFAHLADLKIRWAAR
jgi:hypothetical protein